MAKITLTDMTSGYQSTAVYNANNTLLEAAIENTLSRDGTTPNTMGANLDMNSNKVVNVTDGTNAQDAVTLSQLTSAVAGTSTITAALISSGSATDGFVLTADGAGGADWEVSSTPSPWTNDVDADGYDIADLGTLDQDGDLSLALTGTVTVSAGTANVTGTGTAFLTEARAGTPIKIGSEVFTVASTSSNTALVLDSNHVAGAAGATAYKDNPYHQIYNGNGELVWNLASGGTSGSNLRLRSDQGDVAVYLDSASQDESTYLGIANDGDGGGTYQYSEFKIVGANGSQAHYQGSTVLGFTTSAGPMYIGDYNTDNRYLKFELDTDKFVKVEDGTKLRILDGGETDYVDIYHDGTDIKIDGTNTRIFNYEANVDGSYIGWFAKNTSQDGYAIVSCQAGDGADYRYMEFGCTGADGFGTPAHADMSYIYYSTTGSTPDYTDLVILNDYGDALKIKDNTTYNSVEIVGDSGNNPTRFQIRNPTGTDYAEYYHDGTDFWTTFTNTGRWNIDGNIELDSNLYLMDTSRTYEALIQNLNGELNIFGTSGGAYDINFDDFESIWFGVKVQLDTTNSRFWVRDGYTFRISDSDDDAYVNFVHDGTDLNVTATGTTAIDYGDIVLREMVLEDVAYQSASEVVSANAVTLTYSEGPGFEVDLEAATGTVTITISGGPPSGDYGAISVKVKQDSTADRTITWAGGSFVWAGGSAHVQNTGSDAISIYNFETWDGGTTWYATGADYE